MPKGIGPLRREIKRCEEHTETMNRWAEENARPRRPIDRLEQWEAEEDNPGVVRREPFMCGHHAAIRVYYSDGSTEVESHAGDEGSDVPCGW